MKLKIVLALFISAFVMDAVVVHALQCGMVDEVVFAHVDNMGYAPRLGSGSQNVFDCVAAIDPDFSQRRFPSSWEAANYWMILYGQALGVGLQPLPAPTG